jgi:hypothetical protein
MRRTTDPRAVAAYILGGVILLGVILMLLIGPGK